MTLAISPRALLLSLSSLGCLASGLGAEDEEPGTAHGALLEIAAAGGTTTRLAVSGIGLDGGSAGTPDLRVPPGPFSCRFRARLFVPDDGEYRFAAHAAGEVLVQVAGSVVLEGRREEPGWIEARSATLAYGLRELDVAVRSARGADLTGLFWSAAAFPLEPLPPASLFLPDGPAPDDEFDRGQELVRRRR